MPGVFREHRSRLAVCPRWTDPESSRILPNFPYALYEAILGEHMGDEILTIREVAELLKINEKTAYKLAADGEIPGFKVGGSWRFDRQEIANWIKRKVEEQQRGNQRDH